MNLKNMSIFFGNKKGKLDSFNNYSPINFTELLNNPKQILVILSSEFVEFLQSLRALSLLLHSYSNVSILISDKKNVFFLEKCFANLKYDYFIYDKTGIPPKIYSKYFDIIIILSKTLNKTLKYYLHKCSRSIKAGIREFEYPEIVNFISHSKNSLSFSVSFFNLVSSILGKEFDIDEFDVKIDISAANLSLSRNILVPFTQYSEGIFLLDISSGLNTTLFSENQISQINQHIRDRLNCNLVLFDWNVKRYEKLISRGNTSSLRLISENNLSLLTALLSNMKMIICPNSKLFHIAQLLKVKSIGVFLQDEKGSFYKSENSIEFVVKNFKLLPIKEIVNRIVESTIKSP